MKKVKYFIAIVIIMGGLGGILKGEILAGIFMFVLGIVMFPPISKTIADSIKLWQTRGIRYGVYILLLAFIGINIEHKPSKQPSTHKEQREIVKIVHATQQPKLTAMEKDNSAFWEKYDPIVKERVYKLIEKKDCAGLQEEFKITVDNMDRIQASGGSAQRNLDLMQFLDDQMKELDCY